MSNLNYKKSIGAGFGGLFQAMIAQKPQNGALDALKIAQGESEINQNNASISKNNAEAQRLNDERLLYSDDALRSSLTKALSGGNQSDRTDAILRLTPLVKNPEQLTDAIGKSFRQLYADNVMNGVPNAAENLNTLSAAEGGKLYSPVGSTGLTLNQGSGLQTTGNPVLFGKTTAKLDSEINENNAQTAKTNKDINTPKTSVITDGSGMPFVINESKGTSQAVDMGGSFIPKDDPVTKAAKIQRAKDLQESLGNSRRVKEALGKYIDILPFAPKTGAGRDYENSVAYFGFGNKEQQEAMAKLTQLEEVLRIAADKPPGAITDKEQAFLAGQMGVLTSKTATIEQKLAAAQNALAMYSSAIDASSQEFDSLDLKMNNPASFGGKSNNKAEQIKTQPSKSKVQFNLANSWVGKQNIRTEQDLNRVIRELKSKGWSRDEVKALLKNNGYE